MFPGKKIREKSRSARANESKKHSKNVWVVYYVFRIIRLIHIYIYIVSYLLVYETSKRKIVTPDYLLYSRYIKVQHYDTNRVMSQDIPDPIKSRFLCLVNIGSLLLLVYETSKRNVRTYST